MTKTDIMTKIRQTYIWRLILYIRGWYSYLYDKNYIELELPKCNEAERDAKLLYPYYWFAENIQVYQPPIVHTPHGDYWYRPTYAIIPLANLTYDDYFKHYIRSAERALIRKAEKNGFTVRQIQYDEHIEEIIEINRSKQERGGRPITKDYMYVQKRDRILKQVNAKIFTFGCFDNRNHLVAYYVFEKITNFYHTVKGIAHADALPFGVMNYLFAFSISELSKLSANEYLIYGTMSENGNGLAMYKKHVGCKVMHIMIVGTKAQRSILKEFTKTHVLHDDSGMNYVLEYVK